MTISIYTSRASIESLLAGTPSIPALKSRLAAVRKLRYDVQKLVIWPALVESLERDARRIETRISVECRTHTKTPGGDNLTTTGVAECRSIAQAPSRSHPRILRPSIVA